MSSVPRLREHKRIGNASKRHIMEIDCDRPDPVIEQIVFSQSLDFLGIPCKNPQFYCLH